MDPIEFKNAELIDHVRQLICQLEDDDENDIGKSKRIEVLERLYKRIIDRELRMV
ncbi:MAG: hypothetical protein HQ509_03715 [Candidatus Marinimicrobia bacterium]|nr:hypothetical protein [Candidatus Neomarinimicrobiota bacterium]